MLTTVGLFFSNGCFVAGTLVHTKEGLRPIEEIKVGDYVLSKPESGTGELAYKRVTNTFVHENREVFGVSYGVGGKGVLLVTTAEHPFWVPTLGVKDPNVKYGTMKIPHGKWVTPLEIFKSEDKYYKSNGKADSVLYYLSAFDGKEYGVGRSAPICTATNKSSKYDYIGPEFAVLWSVDRSSQSQQEGGGVDFRTVPPQNMGGFIGLNRTSRNNDKATWVEGTTEYLTRGYQPRLCTVYNLEVEDYHTYFVGEHGIWVHNIHCK